MGKKSFLLKTESFLINTQGPFCFKKLLAQTTQQIKQSEIEGPAKKQNQGDSRAVRQRRRKLKRA
jgi:hypothetical protein